MEPSISRLGLFPPSWVWLLTFKLKQELIHIFIPIYQQQKQVFNKVARILKIIVSTPKNLCKGHLIYEKTYHNTSESVTILNQTELM